MKYSLLFFFFSILFFGCLPQGIIGSYSKTSVAYAEDFKQYLEPDAKLIQSWYHYTIELTPKEKYILKLYYPEKNTMTSRKEYSDAGMTILEGKYTSYTDEGQLNIEGFYRDNKETGEWKIYNERTGKISEKGNYSLGEKDGKWTQYDSTGIVAATYIYKKDKKNGPYQVFKAGELYESGVFVDGNVENTTMATTGTKSIYAPVLADAILKMAEYPACQSVIVDSLRIQCQTREMMHFIQTNLYYPPKARQMEVEGTAYISFVVREDGAVTQVKAVKGLCGPIEETCIRAVRMMPNWTPTQQYGKAVSSSMTIPISFGILY